MIQPSPSVTFEDSPKLGDFLQHDVSVLLSVSSVDKPVLLKTI